MSEAAAMTKPMDACTLPEADTDTDAPQHQKVPDLVTTTTTTGPPQPADEPTAPRSKKRKSKKNKRRSDNPLSTESSSSFSSLVAQPSMPPPTKTAARKVGKIVPLFIASIGNPPPTYAHTLHSAGHTLLDVMRDLRHFPPWQKERLLGNGLVSRQAEAGVAPHFSFLPGILGAKKSGGVAEGEENWTLWQSPSLMNVSGKALAQAWGRWKRENTEGELVVVHDELERGLGKVIVRRGGSARGHNGLKSIATQLPGMTYVRVGVGIGRPESREPNDVARYVLRKMTDGERRAVEGTADEVIRKLWEVQEGRV